MTGKTESPPVVPTPPRSAKDERAERLAAALRSNLHRRKDQARGRAVEPPERAGDGDGPAGADGGGEG